MATVWAQVLNVGGRELWQGQEVIAGTQSLVICRYNAQITARSRFVFGSSILQIEHVRNVHRKNRKLVCQCWEDREAEILIPTTLTLTVAPNPSFPSGLVTLTATVEGGDGTETGTVTFRDGGTSIGSGTLAAGVATFGTSTLSNGNHTLSAVYGGDANYFGSASRTVVEDVIG